MSWGRNNEVLALEKCQEEKLMSGNKTLVVTNSGLWVSPHYPFLGASPDGSVYDYSEPIPFGVVEVK